MNNEQATRSTIDDQGYVHSGDLGKYVDGFLEITGWIKELIITAGGENIAPIPIESSFLEKCTIAWNIVLIGEQRNFLSALITLKTEMPDPFGDLTNKL